MDLAPECQILCSTPVGVRDFLYEHLLHVIKEFTLFWFWRLAFCFLCDDDCCCFCFYKFKKKGVTRAKQQIVRPSKLFTIPIWKNITQSEKVILLALYWSYETRSDRDELLILLVWQWLRNRVEISPQLCLCFVLFHNLNIKLTRWRFSDYVLFFAFGNCRLVMVFMHIRHSAFFCWAILFTLRPHDHSNAIFSIWGYLASDFEIFANKLEREQALQIERYEMQYQLQSLSERTWFVQFGPQNEKEKTSKTKT